MSGMMSKASSPPSPSTPPQRHVERLCVLDGIAIATGWSLGDVPRLAFDGAPAADQVASSHHRPDLEALTGPGTNTAGFRLAAPMPDGITGNDGITVLFADGAQLRRTVRRAEEGLGAVHDRFLGNVRNTRGASLLEIGSRARSGNTYRHHFPTLGRYVGLDVAPGENVDLVADAHTMSRVLTEPFDFAYSISVFEHLLMPWVVAAELNAVLKTGGQAFIQSHAAWPLHEEPWDFFRFSKDAWRGLFNPLTGFEILGASCALEAMIVPAEAGGGALQDLDGQPTYLLSGAHVRKTGPAELRWQADPARIYDMAYAH